MQKARPDPQRIVVRVPNWIGDAVMSTPALIFLKKLYPDAHITVLAKEWVRDVFEFNPAVDEIITLKNGYRENAQVLKEKKFDEGILFTNSFSSALIFFLSSISKRTGYSTDGRFLLLTNRIKRSPNFKEEHQVDYYLNIVKKVGKDMGISENYPLPDRLFWYVTDTEKEKADKLLKEVGILPGKDIIIGINPGASFGPTKRWFPERFSELADRLIEKYRAKIIILGGVSDREIVEEVVGRMKSTPVNFAGRVNLRELAALIARCNIFITNDTGPMHIAVAVGTKVLTIFGSTDPVRTGPIGPGHIIVQKKLECSPCFKPCCNQNNYQCLDIPVEDVLKRMESSNVF